MRKIRSKTQVQLEGELGKPLEQIVREALEDHTSISEAARSVGVHRNTFREWVRDLGIPVERGLIVRDKVA